MTKIHNIDAVAIRKSLERLDQIAKDNPELIDHSAASAEAWTETIKEIEQMNARPKELDDSIPVNIRIPQEMIDRVDEVGQDLKSQGLAMSRAAVIRYLIENGLKAHEANK